MIKYLLILSLLFTYGIVSVIIDKIEESDKAWAKPTPYYMEVLK